MAAPAPATPQLDAVTVARLLRLEHPPTPEQAAVIEAPLAPAVVIAGAGSGKTETMAARVVWLVANRLVAPEAVLGLTFTRKAAAELAGRVRRRLAQWRAVVQREWPQDEDHLALLRAGEPTVCTYAAFSGRLVADHALRLGAEPDARLVSPAQDWILADTAVRRFAGPMPEDIGVPASVVRFVIGMAGQFADHLLGVEDVRDFCARTRADLDRIAAAGRLNTSGPVGAFLTSLRQREALLGIVAEFLAAKRRAGAVDFGDQMVLAARLAALPEVRADLRARFGAVLLDEYQDTGHAQVELLRGLFGPGAATEGADVAGGDVAGGGADPRGVAAAGSAHPVTAVGDPFQSIYGWRGASAGTIERFADRFRAGADEPARVYRLATSFRNDHAVLAAANLIAEPLQGRATVVLRARPGAGAGRVAVARLATCEDEAVWVAHAVADWWSAAPQGNRTAAVLVRRRSQMPLLTDALASAGLPVEVVGLGGLLTTPEVADVVATLRVLAGIEAAPELARLLTGPRWRIAPHDLAALGRRARELGGEQDPATLVEALDDLGPAARYSPPGYARMRQMADELRRLRRRVGAPLAELVAEIEHVSGLGIEVAARADRAAVGRVHLDRFLEEATG
ncbi:MAG: ATP-dependent helicase, partial [Jatrophihabitans sp.]